MYCVHPNGINSVACAATAIFQNCKTLDMNIFVLVVVSFSALLMLGEVADASGIRFQNEELQMHMEGGVVGEGEGCDCHTCSGGGCCGQPGTACAPYCYCFGSGYDYRCQHCDL